MRHGPRATPGRFRTRVITAGVTPSLHVNYKHTTIKQYHKEGKALRTETTINDTRDFGIGKRLTNLPALREIGYTANRRLLRVQQLSHDPITGTDALAAITSTLHHRHRRPHPRAAVRRATHPRTAIGTAGVPMPPQRLHQQRPAHLHRRTARTRPRHRHRRADDLRPAPPENPRTDHPRSQAHTATWSPITAWTPRSSSPASRTAYCAAASPNSPPSHPPRAVCDPPPPHTAPRSKTSPPQHNSRNETPTATTPLEHKQTRPTHHRLDSKIRLRRI